MDWNKLGGGLDSFLNQAAKVGDVYAKVRLAKMGVATPQPTTILQTTGANDPAVVVGQPAQVQAVNPIVDRLLNIGQTTAEGASKAALANEARKSLPFLIGGVALAITIFLLTKKG